MPGCQQADASWEVVGVTSMTRTRQDLDRNLALDLVRVTEAAAMAAGRWVGRGDKEGGDGAAVDAMRRLINSIPMRGVVVIGEGEKDQARSEEHTSELQS